MNIRFFFLDIKTNIENRTRLKLFINELFDKEGFNLGSLTYVFCSDKYLLKLNRDFLKHDYYTDILTFDLSSITNEKNGEVYISIERVKENAQRFKRSFKNEIHRVIFHGALHLCGYKDKTKKQVIDMRFAENKYLSLYFS